MRQRIHFQTAAFLTLCRFEYGSFTALRFRMTGGGMAEITSSLCFSEYSEQAAKLSYSNDSVCFKDSLFSGCFYSREVWWHWID